MGNSAWPSPPTLNNAVAGQVTADFGATADGNSVTLSVSATSVTASTKIIVSVYDGATDDHDAGDAALERVVAYPTNLTAGVGFDIVVTAPNPTHGKFLVNYIFV